MLQAIAIFLFLLAALSALVTYISAHNTSGIKIGGLNLGNWLSLPDLVKPGSIATITLLLGALTAGMWPALTVYGDCSDLAKDALEAREGLITFDLEDSGGKVEVLTFEPSEAMISYFKENEPCFEIPRELSFQRISFAEPIEDEENPWTLEDRAKAIELLKANIDQIGIIVKATQSSSFTLEQLEKELWVRHYLKWIDEPLLDKDGNETKDDEGKVVTNKSLVPSKAKLQEEIDAINDNPRIRTKYKQRNIAAAEKAFEALKTAYEEREAAFKLEIRPLLTWVKKYRVRIGSKQAMMVPAGVSECQTDALKKETEKNIKRKNSNFSEAELTRGMKMTEDNPFSDHASYLDADDEDSSPLVTGPEQDSGDSLQVILFLKATKKVEKLGRNTTTGEVDFERYPQVRDAIFRQLLAEEIEGSYSGELSSSMAIAYAQSAAEAELSCYLTAQIARETCNLDTIKCDEEKSDSEDGLSDDAIQEMISECKDKRTKCYNAEQEAEEGADTPEICIEAEKVCNHSAVDACNEAERTCEIESVTESLDITAKRCKTRVHAEVKRKCYADQTSIVDAAAVDEEEGEEG
jgi:hypothetical protein